MKKALERVNSKYDLEEEKRIKDRPIEILQPNEQKQKGMSRKEESQKPIAIQNGKEEVNLFLLTDDIILNIGNLKEST